MTTGFYFPTCQFVNLAVPFDMVAGFAPATGINCLGAPADSMCRRPLAMDDVVGDVKRDVNMVVAPVVERSTGYWPPHMHLGLYRAMHT